ncbi:MAG: uroporphyrinogen decarboxylase family protein [Clostridia bacterium]
MEHQIENNAKYPKSYWERIELFENAVACREKGRIVVAPQIQYLPIFLYEETTIRKVMEDYTNAYAPWMRYHEEYQPDLAWGLQSIFPSPFLEAMGCNYVKWPGKHIKEDKIGFQVVEGEYMLQDEYMDYANDPTGYMMTKVLPRQFSKLGGLAKVDLSNVLYLGAMYQILPFALPDVQETMDSLKKAGEEAMRAVAANGKLMEMLAKGGWPAANEFVANVPFDVFNDTLRGVMNATMDMYECPDEMLCAIEATTKIQIRKIKEHMMKFPTRSVYFYMHNGTDEFMRTSLFEKFYWPGLKACIDTVIEMGGVAKVYTQGNVEQKLDILAEVPAGKVIYYIIDTDIKKAKEKLGRVACLAGGVDGVLLQYGTKEQVIRNVREVLEICMPGGGYILDTKIQLDNARPENLHALFDTAFQYGVY